MHTASEATQIKVSMCCAPFIFKKSLHARPGRDCCLWSLQMHPGGTITDNALLWCQWAASTMAERTLHLDWNFPKQRCSNQGLGPATFEKDKSCWTTEPTQALWLKTVLLLHDFEQHWLMQWQFLLLRCWNQNWQRNKTKNWGSKKKTMTCETLDVAHVSCFHGSCSLCPFPFQCKRWMNVHKLNSDDSISTRIDSHMGDTHVQKSGAKCSNNTHFSYQQNGAQND